MSTLNLDGFVHGFNLKNKSEKEISLKPAYKKYEDFRRKIEKLKVDSEGNIKILCKEFNSYRTDVANILEKRKNAGQENLRSSMMEEFFVHLLSDLILSKFQTTPPNFFIGKGNGYVDLTFSPKTFTGIFNEPGEYFHSKDQDFMFGAQFSISMSAVNSSQVSTSKIIVPVVAIECKTYLERNMLDSCAGTATRIKKATPYCLYIVASEYLKLKDSHPELTDIDEVYVLCRESNADRLKKQKAGQDITPINEDLILDIFNLVSKHLNRVWWQPENAISQGKVINRF
jgi:hypothetical protein